MTGQHRFVADDYPTAADWLESGAEQDDDLTPAPWVLDPEWDHQAERSAYGMGGRHV